MYCSNVLFQYSHLPVYYSSVVTCYSQCIILVSHMVQPVYYSIVVTWYSQCIILMQSRGLASVSFQCRNVVQSVYYASTQEQLWPGGQFGLNKICKQCCFQIFFISYRYINLNLLIYRTINLYFFEAFSQVSKSHLSGDA